MKRTLAFLAIVLSTACQDAPPANPEFDDAVAFAFANFEADTDEVAFAMRALEEQVYLSMDVEASSPADRGLTLSPLTEEHVAALEHPGRDLTRALPVAVAGLSPHDLVHHPMVPVQAGPRSDRISPNRLEPTTTSNLSGFSTKCAASISI